MVEKISISTYGAYVDGSELWIPSKEINALFFLKTGEEKCAEYVSKFDNIKNNEAWKIQKVINYNEKLFFFSRFAYQVWIFDKATNEMTTIVYDTREFARIVDIVVVENEVWILSNTFKVPIFVFDLQQSKLVKKIIWKGNEQANISDSSSFTRAVVLKECIYISTRERMNIYICKIECRSNKVSFYKLPDTQCINCIGIKDEKVWALIKNMDDKMVLTSYDTEFEKSIDAIELQEVGEMIDNKMKYVQLLCYKENILLIPAIGENIVVYNFEKREEKKLAYPKEFGNRKKEQNMFFESMEIDNKLYLFPFSGKRMLILELDSMMIEAKEVSSDCSTWLEACRRSKNALLAENTNINLSNIMEFILNDSIKFQTLKHDTCIGEKIYEQVRVY